MTRTSAIYSKIVSEAPAQRGRPKGSKDRRPRVIRRAAEDTGAGGRLRRGGLANRFEDVAVTSL